MKKMRVMFLIMLVCILLSNSVFAASDISNSYDETITIEDAKQRIDSLLSKYLPDQNYKIGDSIQKNNTILLSDLERELKELEDKLQGSKSIRILNQDDGGVIFAYPARLKDQAMDELSKVINPLEKAISLQTIVPCATRTYSFNVPIGVIVTPTLRVSATATYYYDSIRQRNLFSAISNIRSSLYGFYVGEATWTQVRVNHWIFDTGREAKFEVEGTLHETLSPFGIPINFVDDWVAGGTIYPPS